MIQVSAAFRSSFPTARMGVLAMCGVSNPASHPPLDERKAELEDKLRTSYAGLDKTGLKQLLPIKAYDAYYKKFDKTYHVLHQLESVALKGKPIPGVAALVEAMFMAELNNLLLTAGHDLDKVAQPLILGVSAGGETYLGIRGKDETIKGGDMMVSDSNGIISSILYGPDFRTRITPETKNALFTVYAPEGIDETQIYAHLQDMEEYVRLIAPDAKTTEMTIL